MQNEICWFENQVIEGCGISKACFHKVRGDQWESIYGKITEKFADKTRIWKNGLHWANTNGYSPKSMKELLGCFQVEPTAWFYQLPQIIPDHMVYFLLDLGSDWHCGEKFWIFESCIPELVQALGLLNQTAFLERGYVDYYIVSKKFKWIIGYNHHDIASFVGEGLKIQY